jgi:uncharacterized protein (DUF1800 family)
MAKTFRETGGDIRQVMRTLLDSPEFWSEGAYRSKLKSPLEMVASATRAAGADVQSAFSLAAQVAQLGQPLYRKEEPTGYSNSSGDWVNSGTLLARMNFALALTANRLPGVKVDLARWEGAAKPQVAKSLLFTEPSAQTRAAIEKGGDTAQIAALVIGSPEFQRR